MNGNLANLNLTDVQVNDDFEPIPPGQYQAKIIESAIEPLRSGNGQRLNLRFQILGPTHQGRLVFEDLNIFHSNPMASDIARRDLKRIALAAGFDGNIADSSVLHDRPMLIRVKIEDDDQYGPRNRITKYGRLTNNAPAPTAPAQPTYTGTQPQQPTTQQSAQQPTQAAVPAWARANQG
ncbi:hypothetical protein CEQ07_05085 [Oligella urethralis]|uniref:DUF669 domain-containing protein n=1 Tax=Oligella urethralis TaxID=90245 RepID=UPI000D010667|nr:DUF669 domain-containing protein [Oligella urethralis]AVL70842.1 hypothetical protein CEQ07_05085 [Oligella urethralis]